MNKRTNMYEPVLTGNDILNGNTNGKQIEEMAKEREEIRKLMKLLDKCVSLNPLCKSEVATVVYGNNYRKIPENAVVVPDIADKDFYAVEKSEWDKMVQGAKDIIREREEKVRKETAEKFVKEVDEFFKPFDKKSPIFLDLLITKIENIAKEITEGKV